MKYSLICLLGIALSAIQAQRDWQEEWQNNGDFRPQRPQALEEYYQCVQNCGMDTNCRLECANLDPTIDSEDAPIPFEQFPHDDAFFEDMFEKEGLEQGLSPQEAYEQLKERFDQMRQEREKQENSPSGGFQPGKRPDIPGRPNGGNLRRTLQNHQEQQDNNGGNEGKQNKNRDDKPKKPTHGNGVDNQTIEDIRKKADSLRQTPMNTQRNQCRAELKKVTQTCRVEGTRQIDQECVLTNLSEACYGSSCGIAKRMQLTIPGCE